MKGFGVYVLVCAALVAVVGGFVSLVLEPALSAGVWAAGAVALLVQAGTTWYRVRSGSRPERLVTVWIVGAGARLASVGLMAVWVVREPALHPASTLVALAGFLFGMLLLEPVLLKHGSAGEIKTR